MRSK
jgi:uncharacterized protein YjlB